MTAFEVRQAGSVPVVVIRDHRAYDNAARLAADIIDAANAAMPNATTEDWAAAVSAAVFQRDHVEEHQADAVKALRRSADPRPALEPGEELDAPRAQQHGQEALAALRDTAAQKPAPSEEIGGVGAAVQGVRVVMSDSVSYGDDWQPGDTARTLIARSAEDYAVGHPIRTLTEALKARIR